MMLSVKRLWARANIITVATAIIIVVTGPRPALSQTFELQCGHSTVRLVCEDHDETGKRCGVSHVEFIRLSGQTKIVRPPKGTWPDFIADTVDCVKSPDTYYVNINFSNGSPCGGCGFEDLFSTEGKPLTRMGKWGDTMMQKLKIDWHPLSSIQLDSNIRLH